MNFDIKTIIFIIGICYLIQVLVFYFQYKSIKKMLGPFWWMMWSISVFVGYILIVLRSYPSILPIAIIFQDIILFLGTIFLYIGIRRFFDLKINFNLIVPFYTSFVILHLFFYIVFDSILIRTILLDFSIALFAFLTAIVLHKNRTTTNKEIINFNAALLFIHASIFTYRVVLLIMGFHLSDLYSANTFNYIQFFDSLFVSILLTFGIIIMVSQRLQSETLEAKTHFEEIFNTSPDAVAINRLSDGMFADSNENFLKISGYSKEEIIGKSTLDHNLWVSRAQRLALIKMIEGVGFCDNHEILFRRKNGEIFTALISAKLIYIKGVPHIISVTHDISERKKMEAALRESESHYRLLTEDVSDVVWKMDQNLCFTYMSPADERLRGYKADEWIGHSCFELFTEEGKAVVHHVVNQMLITKEQALKSNTISFEAQQICKDGSWIWTEVLSTVEFDIKKNIIGYHGISRDISERKKAEQEIHIKNMELQKVNSEKDKFFSIIAHDLKSPFNSIVGFSELLVEKANENDLDGIKVFADTILKSAQRVLGLLNNLMVWSLSQTGRMIFNPESFNLTDMVDENIELFYDIAAQKEIHITKKIVDKITIYADNSMISTVLRNLISNAIKFTPSGGTIIISAIKSQNEVTVSVKDSGIGISEDSMERLFRIDENFSTRGTQNEQGTGLGLILCKEFVENHGGRIWIESKHGEGSVVIFTLPTNVESIKTRNKK